MPAVTGDTAARRLTLTAPEWTLLCRRAGIRPPEGFGGDVTDSDLTPAAATLTTRGVLTAGGAPTPPVAANLAVWAAPRVLVRTEVAVRGHGLRGRYAVAGRLGASLFTLAGGAVELSLFPATALGPELVRAVPAPPEGLADPGGIGEALAGSGAAPAPVQGRLPLSALAEYAPTSAFTGPGAVATTLDLTAAQAALAAAVTARTVGVLRCLVSGVVPDAGTRAPDGGARAPGTVLAAQVVWLLTDAGWVGLRPRPDGSGQQLVDLVPARRSELAGWLAPYLARILEVIDDRA